MIRRGIVGGIAAALVIFASGGNSPAQAQTEKPTAPYAGAPLNLGGVEFRIRSATIAPKGSGDAAIRFTLSAANKSGGPVGMFVIARETSAATDSGALLNNAFYMVVSGIGKCGADYREQCLKAKNSFLVTVPANVTANVIIEIPVGGGVPTETKALLVAAKKADLSVNLYMTGDAGGGEGIVPLTFTDEPIRNMYH